LDWLLIHALEGMARGIQVTWLAAFVYAMDDVAKALFASTWFVYRIAKVVGNNCATEKSLALNLPVRYAD
jgi:hypothetical protein